MLKDTDIHIERTTYNIVAADMKIFGKESLRLIVVNTIFYIVLILLVTKHNIIPMCRRLPIQDYPKHCLPQYTLPVTKPAFPNSFYDSLL